MLPPNVMCPEVERFCPVVHLCTAYGSIVITGTHCYSIAWHRLWNHSCLSCLSVCHLSYGCTGTHCYSIAWHRLWNHSCLSLLSVCLSAIVYLPYSCTSDLILMKLCSIVWNLKRKIEFIRGQNLTIPSPIFLIFTSVLHFSGKFEQ